MGQKAKGQGLGVRRVDMMGDLAPVQRHVPLDLSQTRRDAGPRDRLPAYGRIAVLWTSGISALERPYLTISNEVITSGIAEAIRANCDGISMYVGVAGGGTQNLVLLSVLGARVTLDGIALVDIQPIQLMNFDALAKIFNESSHETYPDMLMRHYHSDRFSMRVPEAAQALYAVKPPMHRKIEVHLHNVDVTEYLRYSGSKGRYFIYLSNVLGVMAARRMRGPNDFGGCDALLDAIRRNPNISSGSLVYIFDGRRWPSDGAASAHDFDPVHLFRKAGRQLHQIYPTQSGPVDNKGILAQTI